MKFVMLFAFLGLGLARATERSLNRTDLNCTGRVHHNVTLTASRVEIFLVPVSGRECRNAGQPVANCHGHQLDSQMLPIAQGPSPVARLEPGQYPGKLARPWLIPGHDFHTGYYPDFESDNESDYLDARGKKLKTLQDFIDGRAEYVTVGMDLIPEVPYATLLCSPELNNHFGMQIPMQVRDHGIDLRGKGFTTVDICVRSEGDSYDIAVNRLITIYV